MIAKRLMLLAASAAAIATGTAAAQEDGEQERGSAIDRLTDVITVTATKSVDPENVQDVPIAMTAFNEESLETLKVRDIEDLSFTSPNVALDDIGTSRGTANFAIRGLGVNSSIPSIDPAVGVFVDGVYLGVNSGIVFDLFDLDSVEILRGPQGLLFGRNTTGGAVLINTGNPTDEFRAKARIAFESPVDDGRGGLNRFYQGTVSGPLIEGKLNGKLGLYYNRDDGYFENLATGEDFGEADTYIVRGALEWMATENLTFLGKVEYMDSDGQGPAGQNRGFFERDTFDFAIDEPGDYTNEVFFSTLRADWDVDFGDGTITNIFGYRNAQGTTLGDIDSTPRFLFHSTSALDQEQISNELRYAGTFGRFNVTTGLFYFNQDVRYDEFRFLVRDLPYSTFIPGVGVVPLPDAPNPNAPPPFFGGGGQDHTVYGVFGQAEYAVTDTLTLTAGLRYNYEEKDADVTYIQARPPCSVLDGSCPTSGTNPFIPGQPNGFSDDDSWTDWTPSIGVQYEPMDNTLVYAEYTKGFRSGGYNFRVTNVPLFVDRVVPLAQDGQFAFDQEEVDSYELGIKWQSPDRKLTLNSAVFYTDISDMQREVNVADPGAAVVQNITNTADAHFTGFELDGQWAVTESLLLMANVGIIDDDYDEVLFDISGDGLVNEQDLALAVPRVPQTTWGASAIHELDLADKGAIVTRLMFQHRDRIAYTDDNVGWIQAADMLDAFLTWETPVEGVEISLYGRNLLDEVQAGNDTQLPFGFGGPLSDGIGDPFGLAPPNGTLSPLKRGRLVGFELTLQR